MVEQEIRHQYPVQLYGGPKDGCRLILPVINHTLIVADFDQPVDDQNIGPMIEPVDSIINGKFDSNSRYLTYTKSGQYTDDMIVNENSTLTVVVWRYDYENHITNIRVCDDGNMKYDVVK